MNGAQQHLQALVHRHGAAHLAPGQPLGLRARTLPERPGDHLDPLDRLPLRRVDREDQRDRHARQRRVHPRLVDRDPGEHADGQVDAVAPDPQPAQHPDQGQTEQAESQPAPRQRLGVEEGDDGQGTDVVGHRQRDQEQPEAGAGLGPDQGQQGQHERGVGGHHHAPGVGGRRTGVDGQEDDRGDGQAGDRRDDRDRGPAAVGQLADGELPLDLQTDREEEQRHQPVVDPVLEVEDQLVRSDQHPGLEMPERVVRGADRRVHPDDRQQGGRDQDRGRRDGVVGDARQGSADALGRRLPALPHPGKEPGGVGADALAVGAAGVTRRAVGSSVRLRHLGRAPLDARAGPSPSTSHGRPGLRPTSRAAPAWRTCPGAPGSAAPTPSPPRR